MEDKPLYYTIQFQNTGTYLAERVRITDLLDTALFLPSLRLVSASHEVTSFELRPGGLLEIIFDSIQLPDSTSNEPESHGFVSFSIARKKSFHDNYSVRNTAAIYFDFNEPIITNEVTTRLKEEVVVISNKEREKLPLGILSLFPNPANNSFNVDFGDNVDENGFLQMYDAYGKAVYQRKINDLKIQFRVEAPDLPQGIYFLHFTGKHSNLSGKIILNGAN
jgi:uncharacterized repeat protein (TIGR01451 family)